MQTITSQERVIVFRSSHSKMMLKKSCSKNFQENIHMKYLWESPFSVLLVAVKH